MRKCRQHMNGGAYFDCDLSQIRIMGLLPARHIPARRGGESECNMLEDERGK